MLGVFEGAVDGDGDGAAVGVVEGLLVGRGVGLLVGVTEGKVLGVFKGFTGGDGDGAAIVSITSCPKMSIGSNRFEGLMLQQYSTYRMADDVICTTQL